MKKTYDKIKLPSHKTKIVCTIGPASRSEIVLEQLMKNGMNIARLNFSFGTLTEHRNDIKQIKKIAQETQKNVTILIDLPGSKIRVGKLESEPLLLQKNSIITLTTKNVIGSNSRISVNYSDLPKSVSKGQVIYLNDGFIQLRIINIREDEVDCKVIVKGFLYSSKGMNLPGSRLFLDSVTPEDLRFVDFGLRQGVNTFGVSFIQGAEDILKVKKFGYNKGKTLYSIAKIERKEAIKNFDEILGIADGIMVARGDLGLEIPLEDVPLVQKKLILKANIRGRPVITATQMLESMKDNTRPTRAEVADVANAILDGTDAIMLSEETAIGNYPIEAIQMMKKIAYATEKKREIEYLSSTVKNHLIRTIAEEHRKVPDIISLNVTEAAKALHVRYILTPTTSGDTARRVCRFKPSSWILAFTREKTTSEFLNLSYGVYPFFMANRNKSWHRPILRFITQKELIRIGDKVILTQRRFTNQQGSTDSFGIISIDDDMKS